MMAGRSEEGGQNPGQSGADEARTRGSCCREEGVFRSTTKIAAGKPWGAFNIMFIIIWT